MANAKEFYNALKTYDASKLTHEEVKACNNILAQPSFTYHSVSSSAEAACGLYVWVWNICKIRSLVLGL
jgi:hypothetical protein